MDILQELIALDKAAAARVEQVRAEQSRLLEETGRTAADENGQAIERERRRLEEFRAEQERALSEKQTSTRAAQAAQIKRLDEVFAANRSDWIAEIFRNITEV